MGLLGNIFNICKDVIGKTIGLFKNTETGRMIAKGFALVSTTLGLATITKVAADVIEKFVGFAVNKISEPTNATEQYLKDAAEGKYREWDRKEYDRIAKNYKDIKPEKKLSAKPDISVTTDLETDTSSRITSGHELRLLEKKADDIVEVMRLWQECIKQPESLRNTEAYEEACRKVERDQMNLFALRKNLRKNRREAKSKGGVYNEGLS